jgi:hypothetical protein
VLQSPEENAYIPKRNGNGNAPKAIVAAG